MLTNLMLAGLLALIYTGHILGGSMVFARIAAALRESLELEPPRAARTATAIISRPHLIWLLLIVLSLLGPNYFIRTGSYSHKALVWAGITLVTAGYAVRTVSKEELAADISHVYDARECGALGVRLTPAVIVDGKVVVSGKAPTVAELKGLLGGPRPGSE